MGKTRVLDEMIAEAVDRGHLVLVGRAFRMEQALPYAVVTQVLRSAASHLADEEANLPAWALDEIRRLLPEIGSAPTEPVPDLFGELTRSGLQRRDGGVGTRLALGVTSLPANSPVEIEMQLEIRP